MKYTPQSNIILFFFDDILRVSIRTDEEYAISRVQIKVIYGDGEEMIFFILLFY